jgi:hypothetical protein
MVRASLVAVLIVPTVPTVRTVPALNHQHHSIVIIVVVVAAAAVVAVHDDGSRDADAAAALTPLSHGCAAVDARQHAARRDYGTQWPSNAPRVVLKLFQKAT